MLDPDLDKYRRMDPRAIVTVAADTIAGGVADDIRADSSPATTASASSNRCATSAGIPRSCPCLPSCCPRSRRRSRSSTAATTPWFRSPNAEFLDERLPSSRLVIIDAGHFVWEEAPAEYASTILDSITGSGA